MKSKRLRWIDALLILMVVLSSSPGIAAIPTIDRLFVFGDSLSDIGNDLILSSEQTSGSILIPSPDRYAEGRFSNGPVWIDQLAEYLDIKQQKLFPSLDSKLSLDKLHSVSYAYGGSGTFPENLTPASLLLPALTVSGLLGQVTDFATDVGSIAAPDALYVIWSGANDYLLSGTPGIAYPPDPEVTVGNIISAIDELYAIGARRFLVLNLPDLGNIPLSALFGATTQGQLSQLTSAHNTLLLDMLQQKSEEYADSSIYHVDVYSLFSVIAAYPHTFGFTNTFTDLGPASNCLIPLNSLNPLFPSQDCSGLSDGMDAGGSVFWDSQHPTTELHHYIGFRAYLCLNQPSSCRL